MKKVKTLLAVGLASMILAGCGDNSGTNPDEHQHTFASAWSTNSTQHWHAATCEHTDQKADLGNHVDANKDNKCDVCQYNMAPTPTKEKIKNVTGGTADEQKSIQTCASRSIVMLDGSASIQIGNKTDLLEDSGNYVLLVTSQVITTNKVKYTVNLEWDVDNTTYLEEFSDKDDTHKILLVKYPGMSGTEGTLQLRLKKISCGGASSVDTGVTYDFNIKKATYIHADAHLSDLNKVIDGPITLKDGTTTLEAGYDLVDYSLDNPYFKSNNPGTEKEYYYVNAAGKFIYNAPDGNWGLIADGDQILEVYAGSAYNILPAYYPAMKNSYVKVVANMGQYQGNIQLGFVTNMIKATASDLEAEPTGTYHAIDDTLVNKIKVTGGHKQCVVGENLSNSLRQLTGTLVPGSLELSEGQLAISSAKRFSFKMNIGDNQVKVAYDYHTDKEAKVGLYDKISALLSDGGTHSYTIKGTLRYNCDDSKPFTATGEWELVPFLADHVAQL